MDCTGTVPFRWLQPTTQKPRKALSGKWNFYHSSSSGNEFQPFQNTVCVCVCLCVCVSERAVCLRLCADDCECSGGSSKASKIQNSSFTLSLYSSPRLCCIVLSQKLDLFFLSFPFSFNLKHPATRFQRYVLCRRHRSRKIHKHTQSH